MNFSIIYVTTKNFEESRKIAKSLVEEQLVACVNIFPEVKSIYRLENKIQKRLRVHL